MTNSTSSQTGVSGTRKLHNSGRSLNWLLVIMLFAGAVFGTATQSTALAGPAPILTSGFTGPDTANPNELITYTATVMVDGADLPSFTLTDYQNYGLDFTAISQVSGPGNFTCGISNGDASCTNITPLTDGSTATFNITARVRTDVSPGYYIYNEFLLSGSYDISGYSPSVVTHVPSNTGITIQGPAQVVPGNTLSYNLLVKNSGSATVANVQLTNTFPAELTYVSSSQSDCTTQVASIKEVKTSGIVSNNTVYCSLDNLAAGETRTITLNFLANGEIGQCFENDATIFVNSQPTFSGKGAKPNIQSGDSASASITTCFGVQPPPEKEQAAPPADLIAQLRVSSNLDVLESSSADISYTLTVTNIGYGKAHKIQVKFPFDPNLTVGYATFDTAGTWVSLVSADSVQIELPDLDHNQSVIATLVMRPSASATSGTSEFNRFSVKWDDAGQSGKANGSNGVRYNLSNATENQNNGNVQLFTPAEVTLSNGQQQTFTGDFFAPGELVTAWYTDQNSKSIALGTALAGPNGEISLGITPTGLAAGEKYVLAAYGNRSGVYGSSVITIAS